MTNVRQGGKSPTADLRSRQFEVLVQSIVDYAIFVTDPHGVIQTWNPGAERLKGYVEAEAVGRSIAMFYPPEDRDAGLPGELLGAAEREGHVEVEGWRVRKDGTRFWANVVITAMRDEAGTLLGFAKITRDLTERRRYEEAIADHNRRLQEANEELAAQTEMLGAQQEELAAQADELREADRMKDRFLSILSHELRTPLNAVLGFASILDDEIAGPLSAKQHAFMGKIMAGTEVLLGLINDLLDMSRIQAGRFSLNMGEVDLGATAREVEAALSSLIAGKEQVLELDLPAIAPVVPGDRQRIHQVLVNLVGNASKFTPAGGRLVVRVGPADGHARVEVIDNGPGIPVASQDRLFEPFFQVDASSTRAAGGTGLGLSISRALIEAHGGRIGVSSGEGRGTTVWFEVPTGPTGRT